MRLSWIGAMSALANLQHCADARLSAADYLKGWGAKLFPYYFETLLHPFFCSVVPMDPDCRINAIEKEFPLLVRTILGPDAEAFLEARGLSAEMRGGSRIPNPNHDPFAAILPYLQGLQQQVTEILVHHLNAFSSIGDLIWWRTFKLMFLALLPISAFIIFDSSILGSCYILLALISWRVVCKSCLGHWSECWILKDKCHNGQAQL